MVVLVELTVPEGINPFLLISFAVTTGLVVCLMAMCMITTSMMLVYILNYRQITDEPFKKVWHTVCEPGNNSLPASHLGGVSWRCSFCLHGRLGAVLLVL